MKQHTDVAYRSAQRYYGKHWLAARQEAAVANDPGTANYLSSGFVNHMSCVSEAGFWPVDEQDYSLVSNQSGFISIYVCGLVSRVAGKVGQRQRWLDLLELRYTCIIAVWSCQHSISVTILNIEFTTIITQNPVAVQSRRQKTDNQSTWNAQPPIFLVGMDILANNLARYS